MAGYDSPTASARSSLKMERSFLTLAGPITPQALLGLRWLHVCHLWEMMRSQAYGRDCRLWSPVGLLPTSKSLGWNMFLMMITRSCRNLTLPSFFSGRQSSSLMKWSNIRRCVWGVSLQFLKVFVEKEIGCFRNQELAEFFSPPLVKGSSPAALKRMYYL